MLRDFAQVVRWMNSEGYTDISGIFDARYVDEQFEQTGVGHSGPALTAKSDLVSGMRNGDTITVEDVTYNVIGVEPDGTGVTLIKLSRD